MDCAGLFSTDTANDTTQEVSAVLATVTVETPQEAVDVREVLEQEVIEVDVQINAEETHDDSDKGNVAQAVPNDATTDTANDTTQYLITSVSHHIVMLTYNV